MDEFNISVKKDCGSLKNPANGRVVTTGTKVESIARYTCNGDYRISGPSSRMCMSNCKWSESEPKCLPPSK